MLDLRRDLYARLVISAQKDRSLNKQFRVSHVDIPYKSALKKFDEATALEKQVAGAPSISSSKDPERSRVDASSRPGIWPIKPVVIEKIDEKVNRIVSDPMVAEIRMDLEIAEGLLKKIKSIDIHNPKIPLLEQTISRLKDALEQKSYI